MEQNIVPPVRHLSSDQTTTEAFPTPMESVEASNDDGRGRIFAVFNSASGSADRNELFLQFDKAFPKSLWAIELFEICKSKKKVQPEDIESTGAVSKIQKVLHIEKTEEVTDYVIWRAGIPLGNVKPAYLEGASREQLDKALMEELKRVKDSGSSYDFVFAAGGDGTVSWVVNGMVGSKIPIVVVPLGTGNAIAQELGIPRGDLVSALTFYSKSLRPATTRRSEVPIIDLSPSSKDHHHHTTSGIAQVYPTPDELHRRTFDLIKLKDKYIVLHVDIGLGALTVEKAGSSHKKLLGTPAYLVSMAKSAWKHKPVTYKITIDEIDSSNNPVPNLQERSITWESIDRTHESSLESGQGIYHVEASEVVICNSSVIGLNPGITWGKDIYPDDGILNIAVFKLQHPGHYANVFADVVKHGNAHHNDRVTYLRATKSVRVELVYDKNAEERKEAERKEKKKQEKEGEEIEEEEGEEGELPLQADGEVAGRTPVFCEIIPKSVTFVAGHLGGGYLSKSTMEGIVEARNNQ